MLKKSKKDRTKDAAQAARGEKSRLEKEKKEAYKQSDHGKAHAWVKGCTAETTDVATLVSQCSDAPKVDRATSNLYPKQFDVHRRQLKDLRDHIEEALSGKDSLSEAAAENVKAVLANANKTIESFKEHRQAWGVVYRLASKKQR